MIYCICIVLLLCLDVIQHVIVMLRSCDQGSPNSKCCNQKNTEQQTNKNFKITQSLYLQLLNTRMETVNPRKNFSTVFLFLHFSHTTALQMFINVFLTHCYIWIWNYLSIISCQKQGIYKANTEWRGTASLRIWGLPMSLLRPQKTHKIHDLE